VLDIVIKTIPHSQQRYNTVGDYFVDSATQSLQIRVSDMGNWMYEALVAFHELAEYLIITHQGVPLDEIDLFDITFEASRGAADFSEPGDCISAPYHQAHMTATALEQKLAFHLGVDWLAYEQAVNAL
jgi:hypothetical protein